MRRRWSIALPHPSTASRPPEGTDCPRTRAIRVLLLGFSLAALVGSGQLQASALLPWPWLVRPAGGPPRRHLGVLLSMLAIALLTRMGPAIARILDENVYSIEAVEEMLASLAAAPQSSPAESEARQRFEAALARAKSNVTEEDERPILDKLAAAYPACFEGDAQARAQAVEALRELGVVNRESMARADAHAKRLEEAGAWAAAFLGAIALGLGILVYRRLRLELEWPLDELRATLSRVRSGNQQVRCHTSRGPQELRQIAKDINWLMDSAFFDASQNQELEKCRSENDLRALALRLLDQSDTPIRVVDERGQLVMANRAALERAETLSDEDWLDEAIANCALTLRRAKVELARVAPQAEEASQPNETAADTPADAETD